jgi:hypothetical protein
MLKRADQKDLVGLPEDLVTAAWDEGPGLLGGFWAICVAGRRGSSTIRVPADTWARLAEAGHRD